MGGDLRSGVQEIRSRFVVIVMVLLAALESINRALTRREENTGCASRSQCEPPIAFVFTKATTRYPAREIPTDSDCFSGPERITPACSVGNCRIIRGKSDVSTECSQENEKQETGWRWTQSLANSSPSKFPANREKYRELSPFAPNPVEINVWQRAL
jgi:hypothetical protein